MVVQFKRHLVTASYVSADMQALDEKAKEAGVTLLCEMGLDPGIGMYPKYLLFLFLYKLF
jgi:saccharopine dehydrogenase-like NADP-dependent oxidoreductase